MQLQIRRQKKSAGGKTSFSLDFGFAPEQLAFSVKRMIFLYKAPEVKTEITTRGSEQ
jgi:hypothetical protein